MCQQYTTITTCGAPGDLDTTILPHQGCGTTHAIVVGRTLCHRIQHPCRCYFGTCDVIVTQPSSALPPSPGGDHIVAANRALCRDCWRRNLLDPQTSVLDGLKFLSFILELQVWDYSYRDAWVGIDNRLGRGKSGEGHWTRCLGRFLVEFRERYPKLFVLMGGVEAPTSQSTDGHDGEDVETEETIVVNEDDDMDVNHENESELSELESDDERLLGVKEAYLNVESHPEATEEPPTRGWSGRLRTRRGTKETDDPGAVLRTTRGNMDAK
jgi:hypothetical protein